MKSSHYLPLDARKDLLMLYIWNYTASHLSLFRKERLLFLDSQAWIPAREVLMALRCTVQVRIKYRQEERSDTQIIRQLSIQAR